MSVEIQFTDHWRDLEKMAKRHDPHVRVGVLGSKGGNAEHSSGITMVELAAIHEFGSPKNNIPQRSWIRSTFDDNAALAAFSVKIVAALLNGKIELDRALDMIGAFAATEIKKNVTQGEHIAPPLQPETIRRKKSTRPLVDTGRMINAVTWEVMA